MVSLRNAGQGVRSLDVRCLGSSGIPRVHMIQSFWLSGKRDRATGPGEACRSLVDLLALWSYHGESNIGHVCRLLLLA